MGSFSATCNILKLTRLAFWIAEVRQLQSYCTAPQSIPWVFWNEQHTCGGTWLVPPFIYATPLNNPEFPWNSSGGQIVPVSQHPRQGGAVHELFFLNLCSWQSEGSSLLVGKLLGLDLTYAFVLGAKERSKFSPPLWHSVMLLYVKAYPPAWTVRVSFHPILGFLGFSVREATRLGCGRGKGIRRGVLLGSFYKPGDFWLSWWRTWNLWQFDFLGWQGGFLCWCRGVLYSSGRFYKGDLYIVIITEGHQEGHVFWRFSCWLTENAFWDSWLFDTDLQCLG